MSKHSPIYLDYAAATPIDKSVVAAMEPYFYEKFHNPSAIYLSGRQVRQDLEQARAGIAQQLGVRSAEIYYTAGATEANNLAIQGVMRQFPEAEVLVSSIEHESVLAPAQLFNCREIPATKNGIVDLAKLEKMISDKTVLISVMLVNNELGTLQPLADIAQLIKLIRKARQAAGNELPLYLHTDAAQAANYLDLNASRLGADMMSLNGGKIYGPKQSGILFAASNVTLKPLIVGGGQERGLRSGTENVAAAIGFGKALELAQAKRTSEVIRLKKLRDVFARSIEDDFPAAIINGSTKHQAPHILNVTFLGVDNERLMMELDERGIMCAVGSACSASSDESSHVLSAIGLTDEQARASLRFSLGHQTSEEQIRKTLIALSELIGK